MGLQVNIIVFLYGFFIIILQVIENGCILMDIEMIIGINSLIYCGLLMLFIVEVINEVDGEVMVSWMMEEFIQDYIYIVEYFVDGGE